MLQGGSDWVWRELELDYELRMKPRHEAANDNQKESAAS